MLQDIPCLQRGISSRIGWRMAVYTNFFYNIQTKYDKSNVLSKQISNELKSKLIW